jgi:hypothetical protein
MQTILALFDAPVPATRAAAAMSAIGLGAGDVAIVPAPPTSGAQVLRVAAPAAAWSLPADSRALRRALDGLGVEASDADTYVEGVARGAILLAVRAPDLTVPLARQIIEAACPPDLATHRARWGIQPDLEYRGSSSHSPVLDLP